MRLERTELRRYVEGKKEYTGSRPGAGVALIAALAGGATMAHVYLPRAFAQDAGAQENQGLNKDGVKAGPGVDTESGKVEPTPGAEQGKQPGQPVQPQRPTSRYQEINDLLDYFDVREGELQTHWRQEEARLDGEWKGRTDNYVNTEVPAWVVERQALLDAISEGTTVYQAGNTKLSNLLDLSGQLKTRLETALSNYKQTGERAWLDKAKEITGKYKTVMDEARRVDGVNSGIRQALEEALRTPEGAEDDQGWIQGLPKKEGERQPEGQDEQRPRQEEGERPEGQPEGKEGAYRSTRMGRYLALSMFFQEAGLELQEPLEAREGQANSSDKIREYRQRLGLPEPQAEGQGEQRPGAEQGEGSGQEKQPDQPEVHPERAAALKLYEAADQESRNLRQAGLDLVRKVRQLDTDYNSLRTSLDQYLADVAERANQYLTGLSDGLDASKRADVDHREDVLESTREFLREHDADLQRGRQEIESGRQPEGEQAPEADKGEKQPDQPEGQGEQGQPGPDAEKGGEPEGQ